MILMCWARLRTCRISMRSIARCKLSHEHFSPRLQKSAATSVFEPGDGVFDSTGGWFVDVGLDVAVAGAKNFYERECWIRRGAWRARIEIAARVERAVSP